MPNKVKPVTATELANAHPEIGAVLEYAQPGWGDLLPELYAAKVQFEAASADVQEKATEEVADMIKRACASGNMDTEANMEFANYVKLSAVREVLAHLWVLPAFFQVKNCPGDQIVIDETPTVDQDWNTQYIGDSGQTVEKQLLTSVSHTIVPWRFISSQRVQWPLRDLQLGQVGDMYKPRKDMEYNMRLTNDAEALVLAAALTMSSGLRDTLTLHPSIVTANIPDANHIDFSDTTTYPTATYGTAGAWTAKKFGQIYDYFQRFASDVEQDGGPLRPKAIFCSSVDMLGLTDFVDLVSCISGTGTQDPAQTVTTPIREEIFRTGNLTNLWGMEVNLVPRNTIGSGTAYIACNKPVGYYLRKPSLDLQDGGQSITHNYKWLEFGICQRMHTMSPWSCRVVKVTL